VCAGEPGHDQLTFRHKEYPVPRILLVCLALSTVGVGWGVPVLTENGQGRAEIVLDAEAPPPTLRFAAEELRDWVARISGATLAIRASPGAMPLRIYLGTPRYSPAIRAAPASLRDDLSRLEGSDGFAIRMLDGQLYIAAAESKGVLNGVYRFLEKNSDIVFVRPFEAETGCGTIYGSNATLRVVSADTWERPAFSTRYWTGDGDGYTWQARNRGVGSYGIEHVYSAGLFRALKQRLREFLVGMFAAGYGRYIEPFDHVESLDRFQRC